MSEIKLYIDKKLKDHGFLDWRITKNNIVPSRPGYKFNDNDIISIKNQIDNFLVNKKSDHIGIRVYSKNKIALKGIGTEERTIITSGNITKNKLKVKYRNEFLKLKDQLKNESVNKIISESIYNDIINKVFGDDIMNNFNKKCLIEFLNGTSNKFNGMINLKWREGLNKLEALDNEIIKWDIVKSKINKMI